MRAESSTIRKENAAIRIWSPAEGNVVFRIFLTDGKKPEREIACVTECPDTKELTTDGCYVCERCGRCTYHGLPCIDNGPKRAKHREGS